MEILAVAVGLLPDADAPLASEHPINLGHQAYGLVEEALLLQLLIKGDEQYEAKGVGPQIAETIRPDALCTHPSEFAEDIVDVLEPGHGLARCGPCGDRPRGTLPLEDQEFSFYLWAQALR